VREGKFLLYKRQYILESIEENWYFKIIIMGYWRFSDAT
jgi:hypothetical protein